MLGRIATLVLFSTALAGAVGCGPSCNKGTLCAVIGQPPNLDVCDGNDYRACTDSNRGQEVPCAAKAELAVCTTNGWTFVPAP